MKSRQPPRLTNADLARLLGDEAEKNTDTLARAFRRASRSAFLWPDHAADLIAQGRELTELHGIGPFLAQQIRQWLEKPPQRETTLPLIRRDFLTMADARKLLTAKPDWAKQLRGDLQMHTRWSDGSGTVRQMADAGRALGYAYIAITDHSKGLQIAGGINEADLRKQAVEIKKANAALRGKLTVLASIEMNLNPQGEGDMDPRALSRLDLVLGSFHSALRKKEDQTARYLAAIQNPDIQILGHPRGRVYNYRVGLKADWARVFAEAAKLDKAVEIDCYPDRQDLNVSLLRIAKREGVRISMGTDAHHAWQLEFIDLGLAAALQAGIPAARIVNFLQVEEFKNWITAVRARAARRRR
jgi:histidinol phosphatase-like PHP family hydrolase